LILSGRNTYPADTVLNAGTLIVGSDHALGTGLLQLNGGTIGCPLFSQFTLANDFTVAGPVTFGGSGDLTFTGTGAVLSGQTMRVANTVGDIGFTGILFGPGSLTKTGDGGLDLSGPNTYGGGTDLHEGFLILTNDSALGSGTLTLRGGTIESGAPSGLTLANNFTVAGPVTFGGSNTLYVTGTGHILTGQTLTVATTNTNTHETFIEFTGILFGPGSLTKTGDGGLELDGTNTYEGGTDLQ
jgi:autotransporter-associated beta strand protein